MKFDERSRRLHYMALGYMAIAALAVATLTVFLQFVTMYVSAGQLMAFALVGLVACTLYYVFYSIAEYRMTSHDLDVAREENKARVEAERLRMEVMQQHINEVDTKMREAISRDFGRVRTTRLPQEASQSDSNKPAKMTHMKSRKPRSTKH